MAKAEKELMVEGEWASPSDEQSPKTISRRGIKIHDRSNPDNTLSFTLITDYPLDEKGKRKEATEAEKVTVVRARYTDSSAIIHMDKSKLRALRDWLTRVIENDQVNVDIPNANDDKLCDSY